MDSDTCVSSTPDTISGYENGKRHAHFISPGAGIPGVPERAEDAACCSCRPKAGNACAAAQRCAHLPDDQNGEMLPIINCLQQTSAAAVTEAAPLAPELPPHEEQSSDPYISLQQEHCALLGQHQQL